MRIVHLTASTFFGGPERQMIGLARHLPPSHRTHILSFGEGGRAEAVRLGPDEERLALRAARAVGAEVAGVDLLPGPGGDWFVIEVNAVPGWRALAPVAGLDVAAAVVAYLAEGA